MRIFTATPVSFRANDHFFSRDSGLICDMLREMGVESRAIMPLPVYPDDREGDVLRAEAADLSSPDWWREQRLDGLVLYSWASPHYLSIARAVKRAGIPFIMHFDACGLDLDIRKASLPLAARQWEHLKNIGVNLMRARNMRLATAVTASPPVIEKLRRHPFFGRSIAEKCHALPCPVASCFFYDGTPKENKIIVVGRWDENLHKRSVYMLQTLEKLYASDLPAGLPVTDIYGSVSQEILRLYQRLPAATKKMILFHGAVPNRELVNAYRKARISLCTSLAEGCHIASCEALCCGCSVVTPSRPRFLDNVMWYTTKQSGRIANGDTPDLLAHTLAEELSAWEKGERSAPHIATTWKPFFDAPSILRTVFNIPL